MLIFLHHACFYFLLLVTWFWWSPFNIVINCILASWRIWVHMPVIFRVTSYIQLHIAVHLAHNFTNILTIPFSTICWFLILVSYYFFLFALVSYTGIFPRLMNIDFSVIRFLIMYNNMVHNLSCIWIFLWICMSVVYLTTNI